MPYDGLVTRAVVTQLNSLLLQGKIEKIYQPESDELVIAVHGKTGKYRLFASVNPSHARLHLIEENLVNPPQPLAFCMLLRKHLSGARIMEISQRGSERVVEISFETLNELGFNVSKKLVFEIMGKHSNIILVDLSTGKIIDSIKRVSFSESRLRQVLPGLEYHYPPEQEKIPFADLTEEDFDAVPDVNGKALLSRIGGICPALANELAEAEKPYEMLRGVIAGVEGRDSDKFSPVVYEAEGSVREFYISPLSEFASCCDEKEFGSVSEALEYFFQRKETSNQGRQKAHDLIHSVKALLDKMYLKKKRLSEDILKAENSEDLRLYGELLTANMHLVKAGMRSVTVTNYYDGSTVEIPLDVKASPQKNAQQYFKKYGKAKTAVKEKQIQLEENDAEIAYLESVLSFLENTDDVAEIDTLKAELVETGYIRYRKVAGYKEKKFKSEPYRYVLDNGMTVLVGRNNKENDILTFKSASKTDLWLHVKDAPGSHVIVQTGGVDISGTITGPVSGLSQAEIDAMDNSQVDAEAVLQAAAIAAYHSGSRDSSNVAVDYVAAKYVKKPAGAKPGMVIFTNNRTVYVDPKVPENK